MWWLVLGMSCLIKRGRWDMTHIRHLLLESICDRIRAMQPPVIGDLEDAFAWKGANDDSFTTASAYTARFQAIWRWGAREVEDIPLERVSWSSIYRLWKAQTRDGKRRELSPVQIPRRGCFTMSPSLWSLKKYVTKGPRDSFLTGSSEEWICRNLMVRKSDFKVWEVVAHVIPIL